jgi:phage repressor protein C with HTH and peptisase S24 domain
MIPEEVMGIGAAPMILDGRVHDWWRLPPSFVKETLRSEVGVLVFLRVLSDTMHPTIKRGDVVLIDQSQTKPVNDQIFALDNNLGAVLRRVILLPHHGSGELTLRGDQKDVEEVTVKASDVKFIGRCVGAFVIL